jgi:hypothetical protein
MSRYTPAYLPHWSRIVGLAIIAYIVTGLLVDLAVPSLLPDSLLTTSIGDSAKAGAFAIWFFLIWRIVKAIKGIYGPESTKYLELTPVWRILLEVTTAYCLAIFCFAVLYVYLVRRDKGAFSEALRLGDAVYFSVVTMTTTGYGDISPKSGLARTVVCIQILFGFLYNILFFSIFAGLAGRTRLR